MRQIKEFWQLPDEVKNERNNDATGGLILILAYNAGLRNGWSEAAVEIDRLKAEIAAMRAGPSEQQSGEDARCERCGQTHFEGDCTADPTYHERHFGSPAPATAEKCFVCGNPGTEISGGVWRCDHHPAYLCPAPATAAIDLLLLQLASAREKIKELEAKNDGMWKSISEYMSRQP